MITLTRQGLLLSLSATVIPSQGSSDVPVAVVNDINTYVGYTLEPRVGYYLNGIYKSTVCPYDTSAKTFSVPAEAFKQIGIIDITLALIDNANANHIETCQTVHATVNKAPLGTVVLPDQTTWQDYVNSYINQLFDSNYKPQFDQIQQDLENLVTEAQQQQQTAEQQQTQIDNAISVMGEYQIVSNDPVQIQFKQGDGTFGPTVDLGDGLASKSMVNAGYYQSIGSQYSGSASDYGIEVEEIVGAYSQGSNPSPDNPQEMKCVEISELHSVGKNYFDKSLMQDNTGTTIVYVPIQVGEGSFTCISDIPNVLSPTGRLSANIFFLAGNVSSGANSLTNGVNVENSMTLNSVNGYVTVAYRSNSGSVNLYNPKDYNVLIVETEKQDTVTLTSPLELRALPNGVADSYENGVITRRVGVVEFDGSNDENWTEGIYGGDTHKQYFLSLNTAKQNTEVLSDKLKNLPIGSSPIAGEWEIRLSDGISVYVPSTETSITNTSQFKTWLQSNPITVWYELATPTTETFEIPRLQSFYPFTNAWCDSIVQPQQITWNVLTGKSSILDGNGNLIQQGYMTPQDNLLINSDFRSGIINQKGQTQYVHSSGARTYGIDCWYVTGENSSMAINDKFLSLNLHNNGDFGCVLNINKDYEKYFTFTIQRNLVEAQSVTFDVSTMNENQDYFFDIDDNTKIGIYFWRSSEAYKAWFYLKRDGVTNIDFMKLERGKYFTGMPIWNETIELLKCYQYQYVLGGAWNNHFGARSDNNYVVITIQTPVQMKKIPTLKALGTSGTVQFTKLGSATLQSANLTSISSISLDRSFIIIRIPIGSYTQFGLGSAIFTSQVCLDAYYY